MSFAASFHSFNVELNHAESKLFSTLRFKIPRHPDEPETFLVARVLTYLHAHEDGLEFSGGYFDPKSPTLFRKDISGQLLRWIYLGCPSADQLQHVLRIKARPRLGIYFCSDEEVDRFCWLMRGISDNWVADIEFYLWPAALLERLAEMLASRNQWCVNFVDHQIMITAGDLYLEGPLEQPQMWERFQLTIAEHEKQA